MAIDIIRKFLDRRKENRDFSNLIMEFDNLVSSSLPRIEFLVADTLKSQDEFKSRRLELLSHQPLSNPDRNHLDALTESIGSFARIIQQYSSQRILELRKLKEICDKISTLKGEEQLAILVENSGESAERFFKETLIASDQQDITDNETPLTTDQLIERLLTNELAYEDSAPERASESAEANKNSKSAREYAQALAFKAAENGGLQFLRNVAQEYIDILKIQASRIKVPLSKTAESRSWALWDIGKQMHLSRNPSDPRNSEKYRPMDPFKSWTSQQEIIDRHLGWEAYNAYRSEQEFRERIDDKVTGAGHDFENAWKLLNLKPKPEVATLSSDKLAELGKLLRTSLY